MSRWHKFKHKIKETWGKLTSKQKQRQTEEDIKRFEATLEGEKGQKMAHEYYHKEEPDRNKLKVDHGERLSKEDDDFPKRKVG